MADAGNNAFGLAALAGRGARERFWAYAAAFGALWGVLETTLGAFLHSLRIPFAGVLLATAAAALMASQRVIYPRRGLTLATGMIAALVKTISPGGVVLGPMLAIFSEALLAESCFLFWGAVAPAAALAGALCSIWSAFQQLLTQYVFYGRGIIELYLAGYARTCHWLGLSGAGRGWALAVIVLLLALPGSAGGLAGVWLGHRGRERLRATPGKP